VSDCLETTVEIGMEYNKLFESLGGETLKLVESLNDMPEWIGAIEEIIQNH
jgi:ferrochelatase